MFDFGKGVLAGSLIVLTVLISGAASTGTPAAHRVAECPTQQTRNPYLLHPANGTTYAWYTTQKADVPIQANSSPRNFYWKGIRCVVNGNSPMGYWRDRNGQYLAANNACTKWVLKDHVSDNGVVTIDYQKKVGTHTYLYFASRSCNAAWNKGRISKVWATDDVAGHNWVATSLSKPKPGLYLKMKADPHKP